MKFFGPLTALQQEYDASKLTAISPQKIALMFSDFINLSRFSSVERTLQHEPFAFLFVSGVLKEEARLALRNDFPKYKEAGFFPHVMQDCGPQINTLLDEILAPEFANEIGRQLGVEQLAQYPTLVTLCSRLNRRHGTIHTDSKSKIVTALIYFNDNWQHGSAGCLRFLSRIDDVDSMIAPEILPVYGNFVAFRRADNSFHGHLPFDGERHVLQIAWLVDDKEKLRKTQRGRFSRVLKKIIGKLDGLWGSGRDKNASHR